MEYEVFGKKYTCDDAASFPIKAVRHRVIRRLYRRFKTIPNAHTDEENTAIHLLKNGGLTNLLWTCSHWEANTPEEVTYLLGFIMELQRDLEASGATIDLLDSFGEKLIVCAYNTSLLFAKKPDEIRVRRLWRGRRGSSW